MTPGASDAFLAGYQGIREAFENEHDFPPHVHYFGGLANAKCKVQKGQVTARDERPGLILPYIRSYPNSEALWTSEGLSIIYINRRTTLRTLSKLGPASANCGF